MGVGQRRCVCLLGVANYCALVGWLVGWSRLLFCLSYRRLPSPPSPQVPRVLRSFQFT